VLQLYRRLLRQWYMDLRVLLRYSGAAGSWGSWLCLLSGSAGLFIKALPSGPVKLALRFLFEKGDPDPFIPGERSPVSKEVKQLLLTPQPLIRLKHPRVMALQNAIAGRELDRRLGVSSGALEMGTGGELLLGSFAGVDRLLSSLLAAAGGREALTSAQELRHRIDTVMPLFLRILSMQADGTRGSLGKGLGRGKLKKKREQFLTFYRSLYPEALKADRQRIIAENRKRREAELIHRLKAATERFRFRLFTEEAELLHRLEIAEEQLGKTVERLSWNYDY
jgi:hypothetical protein